MFEFSGMKILLMLEKINWLLIFVANSKTNPSPGECYVGREEGYVGREECYVGLENEIM